MGGGAVGGKGTVAVGRRRALESTMKAALMYIYVLLMDSVEGKIQIAWLKDLNFITSLTLFPRRNTMRFLSLRLLRDFSFELISSPRWLLNTVVLSKCLKVHL